MKNTYLQNALTESFNKFGNKIAIENGTKEITYLELDKKSNA
ncbi:MAG: long-chain fatty acid--CoA ligase, partial [bacterium]|nr:long-chain fatty acid--CoA ligase [bacterium]